MPGGEFPGEIRTTAVAAAEALYRLTEVAGFDPALKFELRKKATEIFVNIAALTIHAIEPSEGIAAETRVSQRHPSLRESTRAAIAGIQELIRFVRQRQYVLVEHAERVLGAYARLNAWLATVGQEQAVSHPRAAGTFATNLNERQQRIIEYLSGNSRVQIGDIRQLFDQSISEKTLQRDLWQLVHFGLIRRQGDNRWTSYSLLGH